MLLSIVPVGVSPALGGEGKVRLSLIIILGFPSSTDGKESSLQCGRPGFHPWVRRSPGEGDGNPLQYSCLENCVDRPWGHKELDMTEH